MLWTVEDCDFLVSVVQTFNHPFANLTITQV